MELINWILVGCAILFTNCNSANDQSIDTFCSPESMPKYDYRATVAGEMTPRMDSVLRIEKRREVFKPCRTQVFIAKFYSDNDKLISNEKISVTPTGKRWEHQTEKQDEIFIEYEFQRDSISDINMSQLNKGLISEHWRNEEITGIIENVESIWMHPFRSNQYNFTQVAPFPQVELPLKIEKKWTDSNISLKGGFGDWSNMKVKSQFEVLARESIQTKYGTIDNCWKIQGISNFELGESTLTYWFDEDLGFVKLEYKNYGSQKLNIELAEIKEKSR